MAIYQWGTSPQYAGDLSAAGDITAGDDLIATDDLSVTDDALVSGTLTIGEDIIFSTANVTPVIQQATDATNSVTGDLLTIQAQDCTGTTTVGGAVRLRSGDGTTDCGDVHITSGTTAASTTRARSLLWYSEATTDEIFLNSSGPSGAFTRATNLVLDAASTLTMRTAGTSRGSISSTGWVSTATPLGFSAAVVSPIINQANDATNSITGDLFTIHAQNATGTTTTGGSLLLKPGTGTSTDGALIIQDADGGEKARWNTTGFGAFGVTPVARPTVAGTVITATNGTALRSLLTALNSLGWINDTSTDV